MVVKVHRVPDVRFLWVFYCSNTYFIQQLDSQSDFPSLPGAKPFLKVCPPPLRVMKLQPDDTAAPSTQTAMVSTVQENVRGLTWLALFLLF